MLVWLVASLSLLSCSFGLSLLRSLLRLQFVATPVFWLIRLIHYFDFPLLRIEVNSAFPRLQFVRYSGFCFPLRLVTPLFRTLLWSYSFVILPLFCSSATPLLFCAITLFSYTTLP